MSTTFKKYADLLVGRRALTEGEIKGLCWALNGVKRVNLTDMQRADLRTLIKTQDERPITRAQTKFGRAWLKRVAFKLNGEPRKNCKLGDCEQAIVKNFSHFRWVGIHNTQEDYAGSGYHKSYTGVWRCYDKAGNYFDYYVLAGGPGGSVDLVVCASNYNMRHQLKLVKGY